MLILDFFYSVLSLLRGILNLSLRLFHLNKKLFNFLVESYTFDSFLQLLQRDSYICFYMSVRSQGLMKRVCLLRLGYYNGYIFKMPCEVSFISFMIGKI